MTDKTYLKCLARERDRERKHRATAKAVTGANALHYDAAHVQGEGETMDFGFDVSDNGEGAEAVYDAVDASIFGRASGCTRIRRRALDLVRRKAPFALPTLKAILKNVGNRAESIWELAKGEKTHRSWVAAKKKYFRDRALLLELFMA